MGRFEGALKASLILTKNHFSTQALAQRNQILALEERGEVEWMLKWVFVPWLVSNEWGGKRGAFILRLKTSRCAETIYLGTSDMVSILPRSFPETQQWMLIGSSDPGRYYRAPGKNSSVKAYRKYRPGVGTTDKSWVFIKEKQTCTCWL
jgi:hypothetical protein